MVIIICIYKIKNINLSVNLAFFFVACYLSVDWSCRGGLFFYMVNKFYFYLLILILNYYI